MATARFYSFVLHARFPPPIQCRELSSLQNSSFVGLRQYTTGNKSNVPKIRKNSMLLGLAGVSVGALVGAGYSLHKLQQSRIPVLNPSIETKSILLESPPDVEVSRSIIFESDCTGLKLQLFQYPTCPFCCKVRAFLDYYGFSYDVVEVNPVMRQQIRWSQYKKVPILLAQVEHGYQQLNDSSMIISALSSYINDQDMELQDVVQFYPSVSYSDNDGAMKTEIMNRYFLMFQDKVIDERSKESVMLERKWRKWADDVLVHTLSPNVYRTQQESLQAFHWFSQAGEWEKHFSPWERYIVVYVGALAMWVVGKKLKKKYSLKDDVRQSLYDECNVWMRALKKQGTQYMGGNSPNLADLAVYGVLNSIEGCQAFQDLLSNTKIGGWYSSMQENVHQHAGSAALNR